MNSLRSPAPGGVFNLGNRKNNSFGSSANLAGNVAKNNFAGNVAKNNFVANAANNVVNAANTAANNVVNAANTAANTVVNVANTVANNVMNTSKGVNISHVILIIALLVLILLFGVFWKNVNNSFKMFYEYIRQLFGAKQMPIEEPDERENVMHKPEAPQNSSDSHKNLVEKILPGKQEVFNISKNSYTYYDAEPLCKALGAELATYEQVKNAYSQGADWCNYGWVKGQMAVYPTQKATWDTLQSGPEKDRLTCGRPGLNGGFFDNPELQYGVNCYGTKPDQKDHDATAVASGEGAPLSPGGLEQEKKVAKYRGETNYISVLPFNGKSWSG